MPVPAVFLFHPFFCGTSTPEELISACEFCSVPPHELSKNKDCFEFYSFAIEGCRIVYDLVRKHNSKMDAEILFMNLIKHGIDKKVHMTRSASFPYTPLTAWDHSNLAGNPTSSAPSH